MMSQADHDRLHAAVLAAEQKTSGEIFCVAAHASGAYAEIPFAYGAAAALLAPPIALALGLRPFALVALLQNGWTVAEAGATHAAVMTTLMGYAIVQALLFAVVGGLVSLPALRHALTPGFIKRTHVHLRAMEQFTHRLHASKAETVVVIYASLAERRVEIVADEDIHAKVGEAFWDSAIKAATTKIRAGDTAGGLIAAVEMCGQALAEHFPSDGSARVEATNDVTEV